MLPLKNWAENFSFSPLHTHAPRSLAELKAAVLEARSRKQMIRVRGSGHSWNPLIASDQHFLHLDQLQGITHVDPATERVRVLAGTKLFHLGQEAFKQGFAMINLGDINRQSLAGATSTGTHGTGLNLQSISNQITWLSYVDAQGELRESKLGDSDFNALRLSLGSLGILHEIELQVTKSYRLKEETMLKKREDFLATLQEDIKDNRHFELFYFPVGDWALVKKMNPTQEIIDQTPLSVFVQKHLEGPVYEALNILASRSQSYSLCDKIMQAFVSPQTRSGWSHEIFPSNRDIRFMEMEYNLPLENFSEAFSEIIAFIKKHKIQTLFPIEIRFVKADDIWLSPAFHRASVYFAVHTYRHEDHRFYFEGVQEIFKHYQGRPHWGKWHSLKNKDFTRLYPRFEDFKKLRESLDPQGVLLNSYLKEILAS